jgi:hypothetical protein
MSPPGFLEIRSHRRGIEGSPQRIPGKQLCFSLLFRNEATAPFGILAISTPCLEAKYEICIIDASITSDYKKRIMKEVKDVLCLGISLLTGPMIREKVEVAKVIKKWNPDLPVILGRWHPSLLPRHTLEAPDADIIAFDGARIATTGHHGFARFVEHRTAYPARVRLNHGFFSFLIGLWINRQLKNIVKLPNPQSACEEAATRERTKLHLKGLLE